MKIAKITVLTVSLLLIPQVVFAQTATTTGTLKQERQAIKQQAVAQSLQSRADTEIQRRIDALSALTTKISSFKRLTADQKTNFSSEITTEISNLQALKTKIDSDSDNTTLRADVKSIVTEYRVFALYIPQIRILDSADRMSSLADSMSTVAANLSTRITQAQQAGKDVTAMTTSLTDMNAKITAAQTQITNAITDVVSLAPAGYPANRTSLLSGRNALQTAFQDLKNAQSDAKSIIQDLHATGEAGSSSIQTGLTPTSELSPTP